MRGREAAGSLKAMDTGDRKQRVEIALLYRKHVHPWDRSTGMNPFGIDSLRCANSFSRAGISLASELSAESSDRAFRNLRLSTIDVAKRARDDDYPL
jgi:hypothetical protein